MKRPSSRMLAVLLLVTGRLSAPSLAVRAAQALCNNKVFVQPAYLSRAALCNGRAAAAELHSQFTSVKASVGRGRGSTLVDEGYRSCDTLDLLSDEVWAAVPPGLSAIVQDLDRLRVELAQATGAPDRWCRTAATNLSAWRPLRLPCR